MKGPICMFPQVPIYKCVMQHQCNVRDFLVGWTDSDATYGKPVLIYSAIITLPTSIIPMY